MADGQRDSINHSEIEILLSEFFDDQDKLAIREIAGLREAMDDPLLVRNQKSTMDSMRKAMAPLEKRIGGMGIDDLLYGKSKDFEMSDRTLYRTHQYALLRVILVSQPRESIMFSCEYVKHVLRGKLHSQIPRTEVKSLGALVHGARSRELLDDTLLARLGLVDYISRIAKHEYGADSVMFESPQEEFRSEVFTLTEAISMYFISRKIGVLLQPVGPSIR